MRSFFLVAYLLGACASGQTLRPPPIGDPPARVTSVEISELEIHAALPDRFQSCPPPGELGQRWVPSIPTWRPETKSAETPTADLLAKIPEGGDFESLPVPNSLDAIETSRAAFRRCYHKGLFQDPTQDGHVAIAVRVGRTGRVSGVESYGACDLTSEVVQCLMDTSRTLRFRPPKEGHATVVVPVSLKEKSPTSRAPTPHDAYTTEVYVALEESRPALHRCEEMARRRNEPFARATFMVSLDGSGRVTTTDVDPWEGSQDLLSCAATVVGQTAFPPPPTGEGHVLLRLVFNPSRASR